jgi:O-antigen/teichoic acid export membrane protein
MLWGVLALYSASICFQAALQSSNQSYRTLWPLMGLSAAFLALAYLLARAYGPYGLAAALWFYQLGVAVVIVRRTCAAFGIPLTAILGEALSFGSLKRVLAMLTAPLRKAAPAGSAA